MRWEEEREKSLEMWCDVQDSQLDTVRGCQSAERLLSQLRPWVEDRSH